MTVKTRTSELLHKIRRTFNRWTLPVRKLSKKIILPGFEGISVYEVSKFFFTGIMKNSINLRASAISFDFIMALAPTVLFFFTFIPYLPIPRLQETILETLHAALPENAFLAVQSTIEDIVSRSHNGLLSLGFFLSIFFASNGMISVMRAFNQSVLVKETRTNSKIRLISIFLVLMVSLSLIISAGLQIGTLRVIFLIRDHVTLPVFLLKVMLFVVKYLVFIALLFFVFSIIYYFAPAKRGMYRFVSAGSTLATVASIITTEIFTYFINNFGHYNKVYGSLGTLIVIFLWININSFIILIGFELNASIYSARTSNGEK